MHKVVDSSYRWVLWLGGPAIFCKDKPKRIIGGFVTKDEKVFQQHGVKRFKRKAFLKFYTELKAQRQKARYE